MFSFRLTPCCCVIVKTTEIETRHESLESMMKGNFYLHLRRANFLCCDQRIWTVGFICLGLCDVIEI